MSDAVQLPPSLHVVPRVAPVRAAEQVDPPKKSQTDNHNSSDQRQESGDAALQRAIASQNRDMHISRDELAKTFVYRSVESDTGQLVWQWPAEQILKHAQYMREIEEQASHKVDEKV
jgi:uncharacterized FlaG/YvyC family protein